jgi:hypothetical protein
LHGVDGLLRCADKLLKRVYIVSKPYICMEFYDVDLEVADAPAPAELQDNAGKAGAGIAARELV